MDDRILYDVRINMISVEELLEEIELLKRTLHNSNLLIGELITRIELLERKI